MKIHTVMERLDDGAVRIVEVSICHDDCPDWKDGRVFTVSEPLAITGLKPIAQELAEAFAEEATDA